MERRGCRKADFYTLRHGDYFMGMNTTKDRTFELIALAGGAQAAELISGKTVLLAAPLKVGPQSTAVCWVGK